MTTKHKHPYSRLTCAEMKLVDGDCIPGTHVVARVFDAIESLGLRAYGPGIDEQDPFFSGSQDYTAKDALARAKLMRQAQTMLQMGISLENIDDLYTHIFGLGVKSLGDWYEMYCGMSPERWHGVGADECHPENWIEDGRLVPHNAITAT